MYATVGTLMQVGRALLCGGYDYDSTVTVSSCYTLGKECSLAQQMPGPRAAAAAKLEGGWWVTGGAYDEDEGILDTTIILVNGE